MTIEVSIDTKWKMIQTAFFHYRYNYLLVFHKYASLLCFAYQNSLLSLPFCADGFTQFSFKGYATSKCRSKRHIQDKEDLIKMKLETWLSNIYCFGRIKPKFKYRSLFDWHLISLHNKCWHSFYLPVCVSWLLTAGINFLFFLFKNKR